MRKEKKARTVILGKHEAATCPLIVGKVKTFKMRTEKSKEKITVATSNNNSTSAEVTTCETSGNKMRLCVNLMPVLAAAKEPVEEEEVEEDDTICEGEEEPETSSKNDPSVIKSVEQTCGSSQGLNLDTKPPLNPRLVLPPITQSKPAPAVCCDLQKRCHTPLPSISLSEQTKTISSNVSIKGPEVVTGQGRDTRPWIDNPLLSKSRSPEFRLPDISMSSLNTLLQTVTQKLAMKKRRGGDEGPWRRVQSDHHLVVVSEQRLREKSVTENRNLDDTKQIPCACERHLNPVREWRTPPLTIKTII
ncbi:uncharacterized protein LOC141767411 isoform X2 [Sebastes fasciatus]|uniref:uncharacterized protein LOC141767411 isoform X2 n=1 Tax=Sebastes fasciatus TaxID=394691 RepID=UPI003D9DEBCB